MATVARSLAKFKLSTPLIHDAPLAPRTTFRVGGPADVLAVPRSADELAALLHAAAEAAIPVTLLGGGANVVIADAGIRGLVIATVGLRGLSVDSSDGTLVTAGSGEPISDVAAFAADTGLAGLDFIYAMPGTAGGAVWMNARCYDGEIAPILHAVHFVARDGTTGVYHPHPDDFGYKISPFQDGARIITSVTFRLRRGDGAALWRRMRELEADRTAKGHFDAPCAGSIFKNNRAFGAPSGRILDELGVRGQRVGGAAVSDRHANIIVNTGTATATDIRILVTELQELVMRRRGFHLEPEVLFPGEWPV